jgi:hypothetical protein
MNAAAIIERVRAAGGEITLAADGIKLRVPLSLRDQAIAQIKAHKADIIALLSRQAAEGRTSAEAIEAGGQNEFVRILPATVASPADGGKPAPWGRAEYKALVALFQERAAIVEFDGGLTRSAAETRAIEHCIVEWLSCHPSSSPPGHCAWCGKSTGASVVPFGTGNRHTWLHPHCWPAWYQRRRADAVAALRAFGIPVPVAPPPFERNIAAERRYQAGLRIAAGRSVDPAMAGGPSVQPGSVQRLESLEGAMDERIAASRSSKDGRDEGS